MCPHAFDGFERRKRGLVREGEEMAGKEARNYSRNTSVCADDSTVGRRVMYISFSSHISSDA